MLTASGPIPFEAWPEQDRTHWQASLVTGSILDDGGVLADRPERDLKRYRHSYGVWLAFITGRNPNRALVSGVDHFDANELRAFLQSLESRLAPCSILSLLVSLRGATRALARGQTLPLLDRAIRHYGRTAKPMRDKQSRMRAVHELRQLGFRLMSESKRGTADLRRANHYRDGLAIAMLAAMPLRIGNLGRLELERSICRLGDRYCVHIAGKDTKSGRPIVFSLPSPLTRPIDVYLEQYRPYFLARRGRWWSDNAAVSFWISSNGTALAPRQLSCRIVDRTREAFGQPVNPHLFRDIVATKIAVEDPEHVGMILPILGHRSLKTSEKHYNQAKTLDATRNYHEVLQDLVGP